VSDRLHGFRIGVDIGGTFTDIVCLDRAGEIYTKKVPSTADNYARATIDGLRDLFQVNDLRGEGTAEVIHGTTVASNTIIELKGAKTGLITTKGFRDTLEIRRLRMPRLYDITWQKPPMLVERHLRTELGERINAKGEILEPLNEFEVRRALEMLRHEGIEALAVCLLNSYANPFHEQRVKSIVMERAPELPVCISSEVLPEIKEYERTSTTVVNTYHAGYPAVSLDAQGESRRNWGIITAADHAIQRRHHERGKRRKDAGVYH
jgi:N-methylhydantoinase A